MNKASDIWQASGNIIYKTTKVYNYAILFGVEKLDWCGYPMRKKIYLFVLTWFTNVTDTHVLIWNRNTGVNTKQKDIHYNVTVTAQ